MLDAAELLPTFNAPSGLFTAHHAAGPRRCCGRSRTSRTTPISGAPRRQALRPGTSPSASTASGRTFVGGALAAARERGAVTALVTANPQAELGALVDHLLAVDTGP